MTFLQPWVLLGLPLIFLPIIIHFLNRLRHRPKPWAAMRFLISATRSSVSQNRLRQFLILLFRVLAVAMLILFLARPLAGGWLGWALSPAPDAIIILLDRSASMEARSGGIPRREQAIKLLAQAVKPFEQTTHLVLIDSVTRSAQEVARGDSLTNLSVTGPSDTAADIPAMLRAAFDWLIDNRAGTAEIWIASDNQRSNWMPEDARWQSVIAQLSGLSQRVRVRLLELNQMPEDNASISMKELLRRPRGSESELAATLEIARNSASAATIPVVLSLNGERSSTELKVESQSMGWRRKIDLGSRSNGGWGSFTLPVDGNLRDNQVYFVYGPDTPLLAAVVSADKDRARDFQFAASSHSGEPAALISPADFGGTSIDKDALLIWQGTLPSGAEADKVRSFAQEGGVAIFFPPDQESAQQFDGASWGQVQNAEATEGYRIAKWEEAEGPLAKSDEHVSLPLPQTTFARRQTINGQKNPLASFEDGAAFLTRQNVGKGEIYFCASLPDPAWSSLGEGPVLVPMLQRMLVEGGRRLQPVATVPCGELSAVDQAQTWTPVDTNEVRDIHSQAGVYRSGNRLLAVNRPAAEDEPEIIDSDAARKLFGALPVQTLQERHLETESLQGEVWRVFVFAVLLFLLAEGILILPGRRQPVSSVGATAKPKPREAQLV
ncbi:MAG TPA: BatA domain-containing protein [Verrucomicrobiae bacterium]|jgi:hypothetical protein